MEMKMRRFVIFAALLFVALFIVSFVGEASISTATKLTILKADIQMDGAVMIEPAAQRGAYNFDTEQQPAEAIQPSDTGFFGPQLIPKNILDCVERINARPTARSIPDSYNHEKGGIIPFGVASI